MKINRRFLMFTYASLSLGMALDTPAQESHPFGGITLMRIDNSAVLDALKGTRRGHAVPLKDRYLLTLVAGNQSYASAPEGILGNHTASGGIACMTWITDGPGSSGRAVFGDGDFWIFRDQSWPPRSFYLCSEFDLRRQDASTAVFSQGKFQAALPIVENYPIVSIDWTDPSISRFRFYGVGLGTITLDEIVEISNRSVQRPVLRAQVIENLRRMSDTREKYAGTLSSFGVKWKADGGDIDIQFNGLINTDQLIVSGRSEVPYAKISVIQKKPILKTLLKEALIDRYGPPTARMEDPTGNKWFTLYWIHDLNGQLLTEEEGNAHAGVRSIVKYGLTMKDLRSTNDLGPWGFGVVMTANIKGMTDVAQGYAVTLHHGHALAHQHFANRLHTVSDLLGSIKEEGQFTPEF